MLPHHAEVFRQLQSQNPDAEVYIATANKVEAGKSPFDAQEKISIMTQQHDIPEDKIIIPAGNNLYAKDSYIDAFSPADKTVLIFAVGEKDMESGDPRFQFKPLKNGDPSYLQKAPEKINSNNVTHMLKHGYVTTAPNVPGVDGEVASASAFRNALLSAPDLESAKETYSKFMGEFNQEIFDLVYDKITGKIMKENIEILKKLAGLLDEAPVVFKPGKGGMDYEPGISKKDQKAAAERPAKAAASDPNTVGFSKIAPEDMISVDTGKPINSRQRARSMANQFPAGADVNDPAVKKEMFLKLLATSPGYVLGEINARLATDDEGLAASDRLSGIVDNLPEGGIMALNDEDRKWTLSLVNNAINNMELARKDAELDKFDDLEAEPEPEMDEPEMVSMDDPEFDAPEDELEMEGLETKEMKNCGCGLRVCKTTGYVDKSLPESIEEADKKIVSFKTSVGIMPGYSDHTPLDFQDYYDWEMKTSKDKPKANIVSQRYGIYKSDFQAHLSESARQLAELRKLSGLNEGGECYQCDGNDEDCPQCKGTGYVQYDDDPNEPSDEEIQAHADAYEIYKKHRDKKEESVDLTSVIEDIVGEDDYDNKYDSEPTVGQMSFEDLCDYLNVTPEECEMDIKDYYDVDEVTDEVMDKYKDDVLIPAANDVSMDHAEFESLEEFETPVVDAPEEDPDDLFLIIDKEGNEVKAGAKLPTNPPATILSAIPPTKLDPGGILTTNGKLGIPNVFGFEVKRKDRPEPRQGELNLPKPDPKQPDLPGMNPKQPKSEDIDTAIDNALEETMLELKKLAGL